MTTAPSSEYLIDPYLPKNEIHLLAGPSGAGKTRWLFGTMLDWQLGRSILGGNSYPAPWIYVSCDRSRASVLRTFESMRIDPYSIPLIAAWDYPKMSLSQIKDAVDSSGADFIVMEGFGSFVDPPCTGNQVKKYIANMHDWITHRRKTLLGVVESPKMKPAEKYENPRQRVSGVATWAHYTETIFLVEFSNPKNPGDPGRTLNLCPRNGTGRTLDLCFDSDGWLRVSKLNASV